MKICWNRWWPLLLWMVSLGIGSSLYGLPLIDRSAWERKVTVKTFDNGLTVLLIERHEAPVFSVFLRVSVGAVQEQVGQTGLAHMFEHMAFKGTDTVGTKDSVQEARALALIENAYQVYQKERHRPGPKDEKKIKELEAAWKKAIKDAEPFVESEKFSHLFSQAGAVGLNAFTNHTETAYMVSLPSNQLELWAYLESERMKKPVMRQFYQERDVVREERRMRTESTVPGRLLEQFFATAFFAHPFGRPVIGWPSDLDHISMTDALRFWETYYTPSNMVIALSGDIDPKVAMPMLEAYFGRLPKRPKPEVRLTEEPTQHAERMVVAKENAEPIYFEGYHRGSVRDKDDPVYSIIAEVLDGGRSSRFYRSLVRDQKVAGVTETWVCTPQEDYPCLFTIVAVPMKGKRALDVKQAISDQLRVLKTDLVSKEELRAAKTRLEVSVLRSLTNNMKLAEMMATHQQLFGDWREIFFQIDKVEQVTAEDIQRVAQKTFVDENRTSAWVEKKSSLQPPLKKTQRKGAKS